MKKNKGAYHYHDFKVAFDVIGKTQMQQAPYSALIGESGMGKTTLIRELKPLVQENKAVVLYTSLANSSSYGFLQLISDTLNLPPRRSKHETVKMIIQTLTIMPHHVHLWVDEAHFLSTEIFHEIKMIGESILEKNSLFSVLLIGQCELKQRLKTPQLYSVARRLDPVIELIGLTREEIYPLIGHIFSEEIVKRFSGDALNYIFEHSSANPSKIVRIVEKCITENPPELIINQQAAVKSGESIDF